MSGKINLLITLLIALLLSGCWDSRGLDKLAFPLAGAYDVHSHDSADIHDPSTKPSKNLIDVTVLVPNLTPKAQTEINVETLSGTSATDVRQQRGLTDADAYVIGMLRVIIVGEKLAERGLNKYMDALLRSADIPGTVYFAVAAGRGEDILKTPEKNYGNMGFFLIGLFEGMKQRTFVPVGTLVDYFNQSPGRNPVAPILERKGDRVIVNGAAVFNKDKLVQKLNVEEGHDLVLLRGLKACSYQPFEATIDNVRHWGSAQVSNSRKVQYYRDQQGHNFMITVKLNGVLAEHSHPVPITEKHLHEIEKNMERQLQDQFETFIAKMQNDFKVDCIDISKYALAKNRRDLEKEVDRPEFIQNANIQVKVNVHLENTSEAR